MKKLIALLVVVTILSPLLAGSAVVGDVDGNGKIDLSEAIYALQVAAGHYPSVSTSCQLAGKGVWLGSTDYIECDVVKVNGSFYICSANHHSSVDFTTDAANWTLLALQAAWETNGTNIYYDRGNVSIGSSNIPQAEVDIHGAVRISVGSGICDETHQGTMQYDASNGGFFGCSSDSNNDGVIGDYAWVKFHTEIACGDGSCDSLSGENCSTCPTDCPCDAGESCISGVCTAVSTCNAGEVVSCYTGPSGTLGVGICTAGFSTCVDGEFGACTGETIPAQEQCDDVDNDCDGQADEDFVVGVEGNGVGENCGWGACEGGVVLCSSDGSYAYCSTESDVSDEICDGVDNDCDGEIDEGDVCSCGSDPPPLGGECPPTCNYCQDGNCVIFGNENGTITCPAGFPCHVECSDLYNCSRAIINCPDDYSCVIDCVDDYSCYDTDINCSAEGTCSVGCGGAYGCEETAVTCGNDACTATCAGTCLSWPSVTCGNSCNCAI